MCTRKSAPINCAGGSHEGGFTLIELVIAVVIVGVLAAVALPTFLDSMRKGRRSEAMTAIGAVQQAQERWRSNQPTYTTALSDLKVTSPTSSGYYTLAVGNPPTGDLKTGYVVTATAAGNQAADTKCKLLAANVVGGGNVQYAGSAASIDWTNPDPGRCWAK